MQRVFILASLAAMLFSVSCGSPGAGSLPAKQGTWISSGGEQYKDANNPWWVKNTSHVTYCIQVDAPTISASSERIETLVASSLEYWKQEFARTTKVFNDEPKALAHYNDIGVAIQTFEKIPCNGSEDLRFQFGYGTLTSPQKTYLKDTARYIGIAVRTEYDETNLRGKGFIFIGSDKGPNRFGPDRQAADVWQYDNLLFLAITHELGHVFGLPHLGNRYSLMGAQILELITDKLVAPFVEKLKFDLGEFGGFLKPKDKGDYCLIDPTELAMAKKFFQLPDGDYCLTFEFQPESRTYKVSSHEFEFRGVHPIGVIDNLDLKIYSMPTNGVILFLNPNQKVFNPATPEDPMWMLLGPYFIAGSGGAQFRLTNGESKPVHLDVASYRFRLSSVIDGKQINLITSGE